MIKYRDGYKYQLVENYMVKTPVETGGVIGSPFLVLQLDGWLLIMSGYAWDGASGPAIDTPDFMRGSLVHDALYQLMRDGHLSIDWRDAADKLLYDICVEDGMSTARAMYVYRAVQAFGGPYASPANPHETLIAPRPVESEASELDEVNED